MRGDSRDRARVSEALVIRATGIIVGFGVLVAGTITAVALFGVSALETGQVRRPSGQLTPTEQIVLDKARVDSSNNARDTGLKVAAGVAALAAALLAWGRMELSRDERRLNRAGHLTDRYSKAVEQLGHATADVQLGGIYALEQLGLDSAEHRRTVIEVLCAFVREHGGIAKDERRQPVTVLAAVNVLHATAPNGPT